MQSCIFCFSKINDSDYLILWQTISKGSGETAHTVHAHMCSLTRAFADCPHQVRVNENPYPKSTYLALSDHHLLLYCNKYHYLPVARSNNFGKWLLGKTFLHLLTHSYAIDLPL